ncbi:MAG: ATP-binding protein [bacterium]
MIRRMTRLLSAVFHSVGFKLFLLFFLIILGLFAIYTGLRSHLQTKILEDTVQLSAFRSGDLIKKSLYRMMLLNDRESLYETILIIGSEPGVERIRIYDKNGEIKFSTLQVEAGHQVDMKAEACYACHSVGEPIKALPMEHRSRVFRTADDRRIMGLIIPINNAPACSNANCHAHDPQKSILGVLDVQMSLSELDFAVSSAGRTTNIISLAFLLAGMILIGSVVYLGIYRPISILKTGTEKLAAGELGYRIDLKRRDELGVLASSFNNMAENLKRAYDELKQWSQKLEKRVEEKTTELEEIHKEMLQVERMASLGKMAATVGHELNNPLSGIVTYAKLLQRKVQRVFTDAPDKDAILEELELIRAESMRCGNIVKNLLIFARGSTLNLRECNLQNIVKRAMDLLGHHIELAGVEAHSDVNIEPEEIVCDPDQILQALVALLVNGVEAMPNGGRLKVDVQNSKADPEMVLITVSDTGPGILSEVREKIFEPFYSTKKGEKGVGLGLAVVYGIVQRHNGKIWVDSKDGKGSTFHIKIPINLHEPNGHPDISED